MKEEELSQESLEFTQQNLPDIIKHLDAKSPQAERFLMEIARLVGLEEVEKFDGTVVKLGADEVTTSSETPPHSNTEGG